jgi:hypothetical protein
MSLTIEQIEEQIATLQQTLDELKNQKLKVSRHFSGQYFDSYQGRLYRRMVSENVPIWETYLDIKKEWILLETRESKEMESMYNRDCIIESQV